MTATVFADYHRAASEAAVAEILNHYKLERATAEIFITDSSRIENEQGLTVWMKFSASDYTKKPFPRDRKGVAEIRFVVGRIDAPVVAIFTRE